MMTIAKKFDFDAAHFLPKVPRSHKCRRMHGHTYAVEVLVSGVLDERGMVIDYAEIAEAWAPVHSLLDHRVLNEIRGLENPTTEILAPFILALLAKRLPIKRVGLGVRVYESSTTWCEVWR